ncbi:LuxR family transcriptional regulator [Nocardioides sp.]|uniref:LuxR family transcriptional regulator n=1 Tax=Nocardioides sp. TaxID=35761 RepID=UPI0039E26A56
MGKYGADERALFEAESIPLYEEIVTSGGIGPADPRSKTPGFELLIDLGLVHQAPETGQWVPQDPTAAQARVVAPLGLQGAKMIEESSRWAHDLNTLNQAWRRSAAAEDRGPFTYLRGPQNIGAYIEGTVTETQEELLTAQPQYGRDTNEGLAASIQLERNALDRGARLLTLYQHSARRSTVTREYVAAVSELGAEVRTLDEFFNRMIVVDRRVAIIPASEDFRTALAIREPAVVAYLVDVFMRTWERARPFTAQDATVMRRIAEEQRAMTMRMLIEGYSDPVSAKRLGVSPRTYAGYVADLKNEFDAETRFQLGYTMGKLGIADAIADLPEDTPSKDD